mgnify:CR=1 FL=1
MKLKMPHKKRETTGVTSVQTGSCNNHPFCELTSYTPLSDCSSRIYKSLREAVPIIDSAIYKLMRLTLDFKLETGNKNLDEFLQNSLNSINVGGNRQGIHSFIASYFEQLLTYGTAIGEMVIADDTLVALYNGELDCIEAKPSENGLDIDFFNTSSGTNVPITNTKCILFSVLNPQPGEITGTSLLKGLPFVSDILMKIYNTIGNNWERAGNLRYAVTYKPSNDASDKAFAKERAQQMAEQWKDAMQSKAVKDFVAVGDVSIKVIGSDSQIMDSEIPVRQLLEQIVAKTGLAPYMFGLSWSTTERMSMEQADILTSELKSYRRTLTPVIDKIANTLLLLEGYPPVAHTVWNDITLRDETELARAELYKAQAEKLRKEIEV